MSDQNVAAAYAEARRRVLRIQHRLAVVRSQAAAAQERMEATSRRISDAESGVQTVQRVDQFTVEPAVHREMTQGLVIEELAQAATEARQAHESGVEMHNEVRDLDDEVVEVRHDLAKIDRDQLSDAEREDVAALENEVASLGWAVTAARPATATVTERMIEVEAQIREVEQSVRSWDTDAPVPAFDALDVDMGAAVERGQSLEQAAADSVWMAEAVTDRSEALAAAAVGRMQGEQERDVPGEFSPGIDPVGPER